MTDKVTPSDPDILKALEDGPGGGAAAPAAPPRSDPDIAKALESGPRGAGWHFDRIRDDFLHYPALMTKAIASGVTGLANTPMALANLADKFIPVPEDITKLTEEARKDPKSWASKTYMIPEVNFGKKFNELAEPANPGDNYLAAGTAGATAGLIGGGVGRLAQFFQATGKEIMQELPRLLSGSVKSGAIPGVAVEAADQNIDFGDNPKAKAAAELLIGAAAAVAAHGVPTGNKIESVAKKLGNARDSDDAGNIVGAAAQTWRKDLAAKLEDAKGKVFGPVKEPDIYASDATHDTMLFGKVPLHSATIDNSGLMQSIHALAHEGGAYQDVYNKFVSKLPSDMKGLFDSLAIGQKPVEVFSPQRGVPRPPEYDPAHAEYWRRGGLDNPDIEGTAGPSGSNYAPGPIDTGTPSQPPPPPLRLPPPVPTSPLVAEASKGKPINARPPGATTQTQPRNKSGRFQKWQYAVAPTEPPGLLATTEDAAPKGPTAQALPVPPKVPMVREEAQGPSEGPQYTVPGRDVTGFHAPLVDAMNLRSRFGEWLANPRLMPKGIDEAHVKAYYAALSGDIRRTMEAHGAGADWDNYNATSTKLYAAGNLLSKFASDVNPDRNDVAGGKAVVKLWNSMRHDSGEITNLREQSPKAADEVAAAFLHERPEQWHSLVPEAQKALVPNPFDRLLLDLHAKSKTNLTEQFRHGRAMIGGGSAGYALAEILRSYGYTHEGNAVMSPGAWAALGIMAPPALRGLGTLRSKPSLLAIPAMGAVAGAAGQKAAADAPSEAPAESPLLRSPTTR